MPSYTGKSEAYRTMARIVLHALGFPTFRHLAAVAGVGHVACADIMYRRKRIYLRANRRCVLALYECIKTTWDRVKFGFNKDEYTLYRNWLNSWRERCLGEIVLWIRPGRRKDAAALKRADHAKRRDKRDAKRKAEMEHALKEFE